MFQFGEFLKTWSLRSNSVTRPVSFNRTKIGGKCQNVKNSNEIFWVIFKHCDIVSLFCTKESWWKMHERKWPTFNAIRETLFKSASDTISGKRQKTRRSARPDIRVEAAASSISSWLIDDALFQEQQQNGDVMTIMNAIQIHDERQHQNYSHYGQKRGSKPKIVN